MVSNLEEVSFEDQLFMNALDNGTKLVNGHYQVPLPFKNSDLCFPDNKGRVIKRLKHLERKLAGSHPFLSIIKSLSKKMQ